MLDKYSPKQEQILGKGRELFWKHGFRRVSIEELCREAGVSKMTFYKYFPNKMELGKAILDLIFEESMQKIRSVGLEHRSTEETLEKIMKLKFEGSLGISEEFIKDLYSDPTSPLREYMEKKTPELFGEVVALYEMGKQDGWVRKDLNIPFLIHFTRKSMDVISQEEVAPYFKNPQDMVMELTRLFIYGIAPHH